MSKYLADDDAIPSTFTGVKNTTSKKLLATIQAEKKEAELAIIAEEHPEQLPLMELADDFKLARANIAQLLAISNQAIIDYSKFAVESNSPKAVEVLSNMIKDTVEMNKNLIDIHQQRERINRTKIDNGVPTTANTPGPTQNNITTQNNIMCSPGDLVKMMREAEENNGNITLVTDVK